MKRKSLIALGLASIFILSAVGCNNTDNAENTNIAENKVALATSVENTETALEDTLIFGTVNLPYADFYYGELKQIEPETDAVTGQYDVNDIVASFGYEAEGMYDAVTSATTSKSKRFEATYFEEVETGVNILGVANVNVAISKALYDDVQNAITNGTICQNPLVELVSAMTVSEQTPAEYKVINSDGTLSKTIGNTVTAENVTATLTTISSWGNYQINFEDETYSGLQHLVTVDSGLTDDCISFDGTTIQITSDTGLTGADFIANLSTAHVNGEKVSGKGLSSIIFTEEGALNLEATTKKDDVEVEIFPASSTYEVTLEATGFPSITFEVTR